jgi:hypothetical protein
MFVKILSNQQKDSKFVLTGQEKVKILHAIFKDNKDESSIKEII